MPCPRCCGGCSRLQLRPGLLGKPERRCSCSMAERRVRRPPVASLPCDCRPRAFPIPAGLPAPVFGAEIEVGDADDIRPARSSVFLGVRSAKTDSLPRFLLTNRPSLDIRPYRSKQCQEPTPDCSVAFRFASRSSEKRPSDDRAAAFLCAGGWMVTEKKSFETTRAEQVQIFIDGGGL